MQNQYVGDIGDFGKYGMLRDLFPDAKLGIVWYLVPNETHKNDGKHIAYLNKDDYRTCDVVLFDKLKRLIRDGCRSVKQVEQLGLFNNDTKFFNLYLTYDGISANSEYGRQKRIKIRQDWLGAAFEATRDCEVIFLDPDNGIEVPSVSKHSKTAPKYIFLDEIEKFCSRQHTLVIYHHLGRQGKHIDQIRKRVEQLEGHLGRKQSIFALRFKPYSPRAYFFITSSEHTEKIKLRLEQLMRTEWKLCFDWVTCN